MKKSILFSLITMMVHTTQAQELGRRGFLGVQMENLTDDLKNIIGIDEEFGVLINNVIPNSTAASAGFQKGDILVSINNNAFRNSNDVVKYIPGLKSDVLFNYVIIRDKKKQTGTALLKPYAVEHYADIDVEYTDVKSSVGLHRIILTKSKQKTQKKPLLVFIGGIGCYSLDTPVDTSRGETQLLNTLARRGFVTARLEKPGVGDGVGHSKPCNEISFEEEKNAYVAAIEKLKKRSDVDENSVYIFGHSMGGVFAPLVAASTNVKGIITYGTIGSNFLEHLAKTRRTIGEAFNFQPEQIDALVKDYCECATYYFADKMTTQQAAKKKEVCAEYLSVFDLRSRSYNDELYSYNIPLLWKGYKGNVLFLWGESDYVSSRDDHEILARALKSYNEARSEFQTVKNTDHGMNKANSFQTATLNQGSYNSEIDLIVLSWLKKIA